MGLLLIEEGRYLGFFVGGFLEKGRTTHDEFLPFLMMNCNYLVMMVFAFPKKGESEGFGWLAEWERRHY